jgi:hypothetical protein
LIIDGWASADLLAAIGAIAALAAVSFTLALSAVRARVPRG